MTHGEKTPRLRWRRRSAAEDCGTWSFVCVHHHSCFFFLIRGVKNYKYQEEKEEEEEEEEEELSMGLDLGRFDQCYRFNKKLT